MKKIKLFLIAVLSLLFCLCAAACSGGDAQLVEDSFTYTCYDYSSFVSVECSFEISASKTAEYRVSYSITVYEKQTDKLLETRNEATTVTVSGTRTISGYFNCDHVVDFSISSGTETDRYLVVLSDLSISEVENENAYQSYAIGFGVAGGALLIGIVVYFIVSQKKKKQ